MNIKNRGQNQKSGALELPVVETVGNNSYSRAKNAAPNVVERFETPVVYMEPLVDDVLKLAVAMVDTTNTHKNQLDKVKSKDESDIS